MYVKNLRIENVRGFLGGEHASDIELPAEPGWFVFAGRNGSGKSTLLRAIALTLAGPDFARQLLPSFAWWVRDGCGQASVSVEYSQGADVDSLVGSGKAPKRALGASLSWGRDPTGPEPVMKASPERSKQLKGPWRGPWSENPRGWLVAGYGPFRRLTGHAPDAQRAMVGPHHMRRLVSLFREDASLLEVIEWLKNERLKELEKREGAEELLNGVIGVLNSDLLPDRARVVEVGSSGLWVERNGTRVELRELSDGYRVALALVLDLIRHMEDAYGRVEFVHTAQGVAVNMPGVVLVDEIDAHLHVSWQQTIGEWLQLRFPMIQFLVTTHSPFVCQAASRNGLFRLPAPGEKSAIERVNDDTFKRVVNGTVDDAVLSELFGMERSESRRAFELKSEWSKLRAKQLRARLTPKEKQRFADLQRQLPLPFEPDAAE